MKIEIDQLPIELCKKMLDVVSRLPKNVQLFLARNEDIILKSFEKLKDFEPVTFPDRDMYVLPATRSTTRKALWRKGFFESHLISDFAKCTPKHEPPQAECLIKPYNINISLYSNELFAELGVASASDFGSNAFSYSQIASLLSCHKEKGNKDGLLLYRGASHFPLMLPTGEVKFITFQFLKRVNSKYRRWTGFFHGNTPYFWPGRLLLSQTI